LTEVVVRERRRYGRAGRIEVDLVTPSGTCTCSQGRWSPLRRADSRALAGWLSELLCHAVVPVRHEYVVVPNRLARPWWPARRVAAVWGVSVDQVPELATRWEVPTVYRSGTPVYRSQEVEERASQVRSGTSRSTTDTILSRRRRSRRSLICRAMESTCSTISGSASALIRVARAATPTAATTRPFSSRIGAATPSTTAVFADHYGPIEVAGGSGMDLPPHPHTGLCSLASLSPKREFGQFVAGCAQLRTGERAR
jgi:hypothetical protein